MWTSCQSCQELEICVFLLGFSEGTLGPVDYRCRAPFRPSVPWCFPVREVHFFRQFVVAKRCEKQLQAARSRSSAAATTIHSSSRAAYSRSRATGQPCGQVAKSCQELEICVFLTRVSEGTLGPVDYRCRAPCRPSVPWCFPVREVHFFRQFVVAKRCGNQLQQPQQKQRSSNNQSSSRAAYSRSRAAGRPCGQVAKSCQELEICVFLLGFQKGR